MNDYINHVLANYLNASVGHTEDEAISILRIDLQNNTEFLTGLRTSLESTFNTSEYSWMSALSENEVFFADNEEAARSYAKKILWTALFE